MLQISVTEANAIELVGTVVGVSDGDTITVLSNQRTYKVRLADIDCPEKKQAFGQKAKQFASELCFRKRVQVDYSRKDKYQRIIGFVKLPDGRILNEELLKNGLAWCYTKYCKSPTYLGLEHEARHNIVGLWSESDPIAPWIYRERKTDNTKVKTLQKNSK